MHKAGWGFVGISGIVTLLLFLLKWMPLAVIAGVLTLFFAYFFRDPERQPPLDAKAIVSPADGQVVFIGRVKPPFSEEEMQKISIFMSIFDVHVNRMPYTGTVERIEYRKGRFLPAYKAEADELNEANTIFCVRETKEPFIIVQIAGILARRIICFLRNKQKVEKGERIGIICFGSKVDLYLPNTATLLPLLGKKVKAGETIIGYWK